MKIQKDFLTKTALALLLFLTAAIVPAAAALCPAPAYAQDIDAKPVDKSALTGLYLPLETLSINPKSMQKEADKLFKPVIAAMGPNVKQGRVEVLAWTEKDFKPTRATSLQDNITRCFKDDGWSYEEVEPKANGTPMTMIMAVRKTPTPRGIIGFWIPTKDVLMLVWTEVVPIKSADDKSSDEATEEWETPAPPARGQGHSIKGILDELTYRPYVVTPPYPGTVAKSTADTAGSSKSAAVGGNVFTVGPGQFTVNVMKNAKPTMLTFTKLAPKPGIVRGYVKDSAGKPLKGAVIGVRSSSAGGFYSGAQGKSDANGYYEISVPWGAAEFYTASCTLEYGEGRAAFGLRPADGEADSFATANGLVENWVLVGYGVADPDRASDQPQYCGNYYGGTFTIDYTLMDSRFPNPTELPEGAEIEVTLAPEGALLDGSKGRTFVVRRKVQDGQRSNFYVNNVPVGTYRITGRLLQGGGSTPLHFKEVGPNASKPFGLDPKEGSDAATLTFRPGTAKAGMSAAAQGNWAELGVHVSR